MPELARRVAETDLATPRGATNTAGALVCYDLIILDAPLKSRVGCMLLLSVAQGTFAGGD